MRALTMPGDLVVDPTAGSGAWGDACERMDLRWIGCDIVKGGSTRIVATPVEIPAQKALQTRQEGAQPGRH
jgi:hypothetical protein